MANHIAKVKKPFTNSEELILLATEDICCEHFREVAVKKIAQGPVSATTIAWRIEEILEDNETQLLEKINTSLW